jgi:hypothetical protein
MYYPKSHITPNLYSNGELSIKNSNTPYTGHYFKTLDGKQFTGRFPGDGKNQELNPYTNTGFSNVESFEANTEEDTRFYPANIDYTLLKNVKLNQGLSTSPTPFYPQPREQDYQLGEFTRYFSKKTNENKYTETSGLFQNSLYIGIQLPWLITGDRDEVIRVNQNIVKLREQQLNISGLGEYLKFNYIKFYR